MNDPILKCVLVEVSKAIAEVEFVAERHQVISILDDAARRIGELAVVKPKAVPIVKPVRPKAVPIVPGHKRKVGYKRTLRSLPQYQEILVALFDANPANTFHTVRQWVARNPSFFHAYFYGTNKMLSGVSSVFSQLVKRGLLLRKTGAGGKELAIPSYCLTFEGIKGAEKLAKEGSLFSETYKKHCKGGRQNALEI